MSGDNGKKREEKCSHSEILVCSDNELEGQKKPLYSYFE